MTRRDNIAMIKRDHPNIVTLPNWRTFSVRHKLVTRDHLLANAKMRRRYKQRDPRFNRRLWQRQGGRGLGRPFRLAKEIAKNSTVQNLGTKSFKRTIKYLLQRNS